MSLSLVELKNSYSVNPLVCITDKLVLQKKSCYYNHFLNFPIVLLDLVCSYLTDGHKYIDLGKIYISWPTYPLSLPIGEQRIKIFALFKKNSPKPVIMATATYKFSLESLDDYHEISERPHGRQVYGDPDDVYNHSKWIVLDQIIYKKQVVGDKMIQTQTEYLYNAKTQPDFF